MQIYCSQEEHRVGTEGSVYHTELIRSCRHLGAASCSWAEKLEPSDLYLKEVISIVKDRSNRRPDVGAVTECQARGSAEAERMQGQPDQRDAHWGWNKQGFETGYLGAGEEQSLKLLGLQLSDKQD